MLPLILLFLLLTKHFVVDFPLQYPFHYLNKGTWMHVGGLCHAGMHMVATGLILFFFIPLNMALILSLADGVIHYLIDYAKMNLNRKLGYTPVNNEKFWWLLGFDQWLHQVTYLIIVGISLSHF